MSTYKWKWLSVCFRVPLPSSFWKPSLGEKFLLTHLNDANNQTCETHISLIIVITVSGSHPSWEICILTSCYFFADDPPVITWAHNAEGGDERSIIPYTRYGIGWHCNFQQQFVKFSTRKIWCIFEDISKLWPRMKVFASIKSVLTSNLSNEGAWRDLTCQTLSPVPLSFIENNRQLMVAGGFYNYST